ncbi:hypothetical protein [Actinomadura bangladeshensis]|uniref:Uncharacterized protein n=1 Tax=Actinomadura bangladeshensis TaxID=453573 RepID=A0A6L9QKK9_9ACTN|nr:hypothetical protein [Actinomadura bangladeshensis]NEA24564.1 hypothetical protein [Actinomadura bangladeshensis]
MSYHVLGRLHGGMVTIQAQDRPHILVFHDGLLAMRYMEAFLRVWPEHAPLLLTRIDVDDREHVVEWIRSLPEMPPGISILFADDLLFLDLVEDLGQLVRQRSPGG